jgi:hypothetical protein
MVDPTLSFLHTLANRLQIGGKYQVTKAIVHPTTWDMINIRILWLLRESLKFQV